MLLKQISKNYVALKMLHLHINTQKPRAWQLDHLLGFSKTSKIRRHLLDHYTCVETFDKVKYMIPQKCDENNAFKRFVTEAVDTCN